MQKRPHATINFGWLQAICDLAGVPIPPYPHVLIPGTAHQDVIEAWELSDRKDKQEALAAMVQKRVR